MVIFSLASFSGGIIVAYRTIIYAQNNYITCNVTKILNRGCYEIQGSGVLMMTQYVQVNDNATAAIGCGKVNNCETSPCRFNVVLFNTYGCSLENENYYKLPNYPHGLYLFSGCVLFVSVIISIFLIYLTYRLITNHSTNDDTQILETSPLLV